MSTRELGLSGRVALVTGGGRGIGREIARALAREGARVGIVARHEDQLDETAQLIRAEGGTVLPLDVDVRDTREVREMVETIERQLGPVDMLLSNAGQWRPMEVLWKAAPDEWENTVATNIFGTRAVLASVLPGMVERRSGRVIIVASSTPLHSYPYLTAYASSKAFLIKLAEELAHELRPYGVQAFAVHPGTCDTNMTKEMRAVNAQTGYAPWLEQIFEEGRANMPEEAANLVMRLFSGEADEFSGSFFDVNHDFDMILDHLRRSGADGFRLSICFPPGAERNCAKPKLPGPLISR